MSKLVGQEVRITWIDVIHISPDSSLKDLVSVEITPMVTYGRIVHANKDAVIISATIGKDEGEEVYRDSVKIPRPFIKSIIILGEV